MQVRPWPRNRTGKELENGNARRDHDRPKGRARVVRYLGMRPHEGGPDTTVPAVEVDGISPARGTRKMPVRDV